MKTILLISISFLSTIICAGQYINNLSIYPLQPKSNDTIYIYPGISFGSGSCDDHTQFISNSGNQFFADAIHCTGMLAVICSTIDTFKINPLPSGNYTFHFSVSQGVYPAPCTPGIFPGPTDSLNFTVNTASYINEITAKNKLFSLYPNPAKDYLTISFKSKNQKRIVEFITIEGKVVETHETAADTFIMNTNSLVNGSYILNVLENDITTRQLVTIHK